MKDLIHFVQEPAAAININGSPYSLVMLENDSLVFSDGSNQITMTEKSLRLSCYHGAGHWKVKHKVSGQVMNTYRMEVYVNGEQKEIQKEKG